MARRVCFITTEFHGLFKNGGIGTANTGLALALAAAGFEVTVAFANSDASGPRLSTGNFADLKAHYATRGITLDYVPPHPLIPTAFNDPRSASYCVFLYVQRGSFDVVLFNDNGGQGYFSLLAKHTGVLVDPPLMCVVAHGPIGWVLELNSQEHWGRDPVAATYMERRSARLADVLISPSRYLIDWMVSRGWAMPQRTCVIQNVVNVTDRIREQRAVSRRLAVTEFVFFGRQEVRKGLALFCDALDLLHQSADLAAVTVTFLGKFSLVAGMHSGIYLAERARRWRTSLRIATVYDQGEALDYLDRPGVLAVIPSLAENSPCVVAECLQLGVPFIATDSGGTAELITPEDRDACLFAPNPVALAARLADALSAGHRPARLAVTQDATLAQWLRLLGQLPDGLDSRDDTTAPEQRPQPLPPIAERPLVSVCLVHTSASLCPDVCLQSVLRQTYPRMELVIARDAGATDLAGIDAAAPFPIRQVETAGRGRGAARDQAARHAAGDFLLFIDETAAVTLLADCVATLVTAAARTGADILAGCPALGDAPAVPIGGCVELGALENCFGEAVVFVASRAYKQGPGYAVECDDAIQDWLFLAGSVLGGCVLEVVPKPLFHSRIVPRRQFDVGGTVRNNRRILHAYRDAPVSMFGHLIETIMQIDRQNLHALADSLHQVSASARDIAVRMSAMEPNSAQASHAFIEYCCERRLVSMALSFALMNGLALVPEAVGFARQATEAAARDIIQWRRLDFWHDLDVTDELRARARPVAPLRPADLVRSPEVAIAHPLGVGISIVKAGAICPPGTGRVRATVTVEPNVGSTVLVAVALCQPGSRLVVSDAMRIGEEGAAWSGWMPAGPEGEVAEVVAPLPEPTADLLDLYLLSRRSDDGPCPEANVVWRRIVAEISVNGDITPSAIEPDTAFFPVPPEVIRQGTLLTDVSDFPFPVFVPGDPTLLHPVPGRTALVRLAGAMPAGAFGLRCLVSAGHAQAHPIDFAVWIRPSTPEPLGIGELSETEGFSGWLTVARPMLHHRLTVTLPVPADAAMDVYLATRVSGRTDVHFCHAYWHELWTMEPSATLPT